MGLIQQASLRQNGANDDAGKKKTGLLEHLTKPSGYDIVRASFLSFLDAAQAERGGLLYPSGSGNFTMLFARGFDISTVSRFTPPADFFDIPVPDDQWIAFSQDTSIAPFLPFFSSTETRSLVSIHVRKIIMADETAYVILVESMKNLHRIALEPETAAGAFDRLIQASSEQKIVLDTLARKTVTRQLPQAMKDHAQSAIDSGKKATLIKICFSGLFPDPLYVHTNTEQKQIYDAIRDRIVRQTGSINLVSIKSNNDVHVAIFSGVPVDGDMYFHQLMKPLEKIFGFERIRKIQFREAGSASALHEIIAFLDGEV